MISKIDEPYLPCLIFLRAKQRKHTFAYTRAVPWNDLLNGLKLLWYALANFH